MDSTKYIGADVRKESISIAVRNAAGKIVMECVIETRASMILQFYICLLTVWMYIATRGVRLRHISKIIMAVPEKDGPLSSQKNTTRRHVKGSRLSSGFSHVNTCSRSWQSSH